MSSTKKSTKNSKRSTAKPRKKSPPKYIFARVDDWEALYVDGVKVCEDHSLDVENVLNALEIPVTVIWANEEIINRFGQFPNDAENIPLEPMFDRT